MEATRSEKRSEKKKKLTFGKVIGRLLLVIFTLVLGVALALTVTLATIIKGPSEAARDTFVTTVLESGNLKFLASVFLSTDEINDIIERTSLKKMEEDVDPNLINTDSDVEGNFDENGVEIVQINGSSYTATLMIVKDPSKVKVATTYDNGWGKEGKTLDKLVKKAGAVGGVNGGLYKADMNSGGTPYGVCVSDGEIQYNNPSGWSGLYMIGLDNNNILRIESISGWTQSKFEQFVKDEGIRDAVAFQDEKKDSNNHFVPLVINGEARQLNGAGSGANPRTAIGQRADGAILLLVTDGRGSAGHLGATASDLISIMLKYGAVNAANLDGGSSSCMFYNEQWLRNSVTLYYVNTSWNLPTSFVVMGGKE